MRGGFGFGSEKSCNFVAESLLIDNDNVKVTVCENEADLLSVVARKPDLVVLAVKRVYQEDGQAIWLADFFEKAGISYTGSMQASMEYDVNKDTAKKQIGICGIKTAAYFTSFPKEYKEGEILPVPYPLFLKPTGSADSHGIDRKSLVSNFAEFEDKVKSLFEIDSKPALVEQYLGGREFTVAIIEDGIDLLVASIEIIPPEENGVRILGEKVKSEDTEILKEVLGEEILAKLADIATKSFRALGARDFARIDIKMDSNEQCYFLEANLTPGMNKGSSYFPEAFDISMGLGYDAVIKLVVKNALARKPVLAQVTNI